jgi:predicted nucleic acid-binding protein
VTTKDVVFETHAVMQRISRELPTADMRPAALRFLDSIDGGLARVLDVTDADHVSARAIVERHRDKTYSLCDALSFAVMERLKITRAASADRRAELRRREELALGTKLATAIGGTFVAEPAAGFRGRLLACEVGSASSTFVRVVDETTRRVALLRAADFHRALEGQVVELTRDPNGRIVARRTGLSRGE